MRKRNYHTSVNLLIQPEMYQSIKQFARVRNTTMSKIIRDGIRMALSKIEKENNAVMEEYGDEQQG